MSDNGRPELSVDTWWEGARLVAVVRCPAAGACVEQPLAVTASGSVELSGVVPGDAVEVRYERGHTRRTPAWRGTPWVERAPSLSGAPAVGQIVRATRGEWAESGWAWGWPGGWKNDASTFIVACRTADGKDCIRITDSYPLSVKLDAAWAGRYLFATTHIYFWNGVVGLQFAGAPHPIGDLSSGPLVARSAPLGPVAISTASVRHRALRVNGGLSVGRVTCPTRCKVKLTVSGGGKTTRRTFSVKGTKALTIPRRYGTLKVKIVVDGKTLAGGRSISPRA